MEKPASGTTKQFKRLLILFTFLFSSTINIFAVNVKESMRGAEIKSTQEFCFTQKSTQFSFTIKDIEPKYIEFYIDKVPDGVIFLSSSKTAEGNGTVINLFFQFENTGTYKINPLVCYIKGYTFYVPFRTVEVYENPDTIHPELSVSFVNPAYNKENAVIKAAAGSHVVYTVSIRYAVQIVDFTYDLPKNSIFTELKRFPITEGIPRKSEFTTEQEKIAMFDWQPLSEGDWTLPQIKVTATSYNGGRFVLQLPERTVRVTQPSADSLIHDSNETVFANAFTESSPGGNEFIKTEITEETVAKIAELRREERKHFPFSKVRKERISLESEYGLNETAKEPCIPFIVCVIVLMFAILTAALILFKKQKYLYALAGMCATFVLVVLTVIFIVKLNVKTALFTGEQLSPVPEETGSVSVVLEKGSHVTVTKKAGKWLYVKINETYGWTTEDNVIYINE